MLNKSIINIGQLNSKNRFTFSPNFSNDNQEVHEESPEGKSVDRPNTREINYVINCDPMTLEIVPPIKYSPAFEPAPTVALSYGNIPRIEKQRISKANKDNSAFLD